MADKACYQAMVTTDSKGNITRIVPVNSASKTNSSSTELVAAKTGGFLSNPILIVGLAAVALLFMGGTHANH